MILFSENKRNLIVKQQEVQIRELQLQVLQERSAHTRLEDIIQDEKQKNEDLERRLNDQEEHMKEQNNLITKLNSNVFYFILFYFIVLYISSYI